MAVKPKRRWRSGRLGHVGCTPRCSRLFQVRAPHTDTAPSHVRCASANITLALRAER